MGLFSRRCLQRLIDENVAFLSPEQTDEHVRRLNRIRQDYLATEWEVAILNALSKLGHVRHEPKDLGGTSLLDAVFTSSAIQFGADIAAVSDEQLHKRNPVDRIWMELERQVRKRKISTGGFEIQIGHAPLIQQGRGIRHDLLIPPVAKLKEVVFNANFKSFMDRIVADPLSERHFGVSNSSADIRITYDPTRTTWGGSHLTYTGANILDNNPVFNALKNKTDQLKLSGYSGLRGVIVCDAGCQMLGRDGTSWAEFPLKQVVEDFMRQHQSIGFVATIGLRHDRSGSVGRGHHKPALSMWISKPWPAEEKALKSALEKMVSLLPTFETSAGNALSRVMSGQRLGSHFGGYEMGGDQYMKVSAITVLQLLAGNISYDEFARAHGFNYGNRFANAFATAVSKGRVIRNCKIEKGGEEDDDWIVFEFSEPDPALAPFVAKRTKPTSA